MKIKYGWIAALGFMSTSAAAANYFVSAPFQFVISFTDREAHQYLANNDGESSKIEDCLILIIDDVGIPKPTKHKVGSCY